MITHVNELPLEILDKIFWLANAGPSSVYLSDDYSSDFEPFSPIRRGFLARDPLNTKNLEARVQASWNTKLAIPLVCKLWRQISFACTYNDIYIGPRCDSLLEHLERPWEQGSLSGGAGFYVRRVILNASQSDPKPVSVSRILGICPKAHTLVKGDNDATLPPDDDGDIDMSSIRRFEWKYIGHRGSIFNRPHNTKGRDFFREICARAKNLQYLMIGIIQPNHRQAQSPPRHITLTSLTTIVLRSIGTPLRQELETFFHFPSLKYIITDSGLVADGFSPIITPDIQRLEFLGDPYLHEFGTLAVLDKCPQLEELSYYAETCTFPPQKVAPHTSLECLRLNISQAVVVTHESIIENITGQFQIYGSTLFPALRRIFLHGDWSSYTEHAGIQIALEGMKSMGYQVEYIRENWEGF